MKNWLTIQYQETQKNSQNEQEQSICIRLDKLFGGL